MMGELSWIKQILKGLGFRVEENHQGENWTAADEFLLRNLTEMKESDARIAKRLGRTKRAVQQKRYAELCRSVTI